MSKLANHRDQAAHLKAQRAFLNFFQDHILAEFEIPLNRDWLEKPNQSRGKMDALHYLIPYLLALQRPCPAGQRHG